MRPLLTALGSLCALTAALDLCARQLARASLLAGLGIAASDWTALALAVFGMLGVLAGCGLRPAKLLKRRIVIATVMATIFAGGVLAQLHLGARLQSDGFYYYAYLRSLWFDRDVDFTNDYRMLGLGDKPHLFQPTATGYAQSAWTIGPALVWSPFFGAGHLVAGVLNARGREISLDGTSFPYRQAVCLAGLFYGILGLWWSGRLAARFFPGAIATLSAVAVGGGTFMIWYALKEPTMTHAPSFAFVALFAYLWASTYGRRTRSQWILLGFLAGLMTTIRWQNAIFCLLPALELAQKSVGSGQQAVGSCGGPRSSAASIQETPLSTAHCPLPTTSSRISAAALFLVSALVGFLPQMLAWKAIYGSYLAVSPIGPEIRWTDPRLIDILWSSRNGLFATSPIAYLATIGLVALAWRRPSFGVPALAAVAAMVYFNAAIQDWWGSAAFGMRRFDGIVPLLTVGLAHAIVVAERGIARRPRIAIVAALAALVLWNLTSMGAALAGQVRIGEPISFSRLASAQGAALERWFGHPFSYPINLLYAIRNGVHPARYDLLGPNRFLSDPTRPYGRIDVGDGSDLEGEMLGPGWHAPEEGGSVTFRWAGQHATLRVPLDHAADLSVQIRLKGFAYHGAPPQQLTLEVNGKRFGPYEVRPEWHVIEARSTAHVWAAGVNSLGLRFAWQTSPQAAGMGGDSRTLSAAVDYVRIQKGRE